MNTPEELHQALCEFLPQDDYFDFMIAGLCDGRLHQSQEPKWKSFVDAHPELAANSKDLQAALETLLLEYTRSSSEISEPYHRTIDTAYELIPVGVLASRPYVTGVSRLYCLPEFLPESVVTCTFDSEGLRIDTVCGATSLDAIDDNPFTPSLVRRRSYFVRSGTKALGVFASWSQFWEAAVNAPSCFTLCMGGTGYRHTFSDGTRSLDFTWHNPDWVRHSVQINLLKMYRRCVWQGWMRSWIPNWRYWRMRFAS